ncbi:diguanylate cyclase [Salinisphaera dokdonensis CL-ES53]|uniref:diguanylate cyclase n=1 Tax=Salinisphaera dokdonensis CL-ES53 TaxID=1304272 RepID=A0ABV2B0A6_9GAMM
MQPADAAEQAPTRLIQRQIDRGFASLRFMPALEREFHDYLRQSSRLSRASLIFLAVAGVLSSALIDSTWLGLPFELVGTTRAIQFTVMMPMALICTLLCLRHPTSRSMEVGMLLLFIVMVAGMMGQRVVDSQQGFDLPLELVGVTAVAMFCLSRVRFWIQLPLLLALIVATVLVELTLVSLGNSGNYDMFSTGILFIVAVVAGYSSEYTIRWTWLNATLLRYLSRLDRLTGLLNRHALESTLAGAHAHGQREGKAYAVAMIDIDAFGAYNDHYGHQYGDAALQQVADALADHARRPLDTCGRYGGEEFVLLWMDCGVEQASALAESVREVVERERIAHAESPAAPWVTVSVGLCHVEVEHADAPIESVLREADRALYKAKREGRNRVVSTRYRSDRTDEENSALPQPWPQQASSGRR